MARQRKARVTSVAYLLSCGIYVTVIATLVTLNLSFNSPGVNNEEMCKVTLYFSMALYGLVKYMSFLFLAERAHTVRSVDLTRRQDKLWIATCIVIVVCYSGIIGFVFVRPRHYLNAEGVCMLGMTDMGFPALFALDTLISGWLVGLFLWFLLPTIREHAEIQGSKHMSFLVRILAGLGASRHQRPVACSTAALVDIPQTHIESVKSPISIVVHPAEDSDTEAASSEYSAKYGCEQPPLTIIIPTSRTTSVSLDPENGLHTVSMMASGIPHASPLQANSLIRKLDGLVKKSIVATIILFLFNVLWLGLFYGYHGPTPAWLCLMVLALDMTTVAGVVFWLTATDSEHS
jgi:hypothetical protein